MGRRSTVGQWGRGVLLVIAAVLSFAASRENLGTNEREHDTRRMLFACGPLGRHGPDGPDGPDGLHDDRIPYRQEKIGFGAGSWFHIHAKPTRRTIYWV